MSNEVNCLINNFSVIASLVGASAWLAPYVYKKLTKPKIEAKLISRFENSGEFNSKKCLLHFMTLNFISLNKSFNIKKVNILLSYKNGENKYVGELYWARQNKWTDSNGNKLTLNIEPEDTLLFTGTLPEGITRKLYLTFKVDKAELEEFEEMSLTFIEQSGHRSTVIIKSSDLNPDQILWDDRIWRKENT